MYDAINVFGTNLFNTRDREFHKKRKVMLAPSYGLPALRSQEQAIKEVGLFVLADKLNKIADSGATVNLLSEFQLMTFDVIGMLALGKHFNLLQGSSHPMMKAFTDNQKASVNRLVFGKLYDIFVGVPKSTHIMRDFAMKALAERREKGSQDDAM